MRRKLNLPAITLDISIEPGATQAHYFYGGKRLCDAKPYGETVWESVTEEPTCHACTVILVDDNMGMAPRMEVVTVNGRTL